MHAGMEHSMIPQYLDTIPTFCHNHITWYMHINCHIQLSHKITHPWSYQHALQTQHMQPSTVFCLQDT